MSSIVQGYFMRILKLTTATYTMEPFTVNRGVNMMIFILCIVGFLLGGWLMMVLPTLDHPELAHCVLAGLLGSILAVNLWIASKLKKLLAKRNEIDSNKQEKTEPF